MNLSDFSFSLKNPNFPAAAFLTWGNKASRVANSDPSSAFSQIINYVIEKEVLTPNSFQTNRQETGRWQDYKSALGPVTEYTTFLSSSHFLYQRGACS